MTDTSAGAAAASPAAGSSAQRLQSATTSAAQSETFKFLNVNVVNVDWPDAMAAVISGSGFRSVGFLHGQGARLLLADDGLASTFNNLSLVFADGIAMRLACRLSGVQLRANVNGTDMFPKMAKLCAAHGWPIYLLGATDAEIDAFSAYLAERFPTLVIAGRHCGYFGLEGEAKIIADVASSQARWLFVGMGCPRQEKFIVRNAAALSEAGLDGAMGVGGLFTTLRKRAPAVFIRLRLEWAWRLAREPRRLYRRYLVEIPALLIVLTLRRLRRR
jgi:N-acetylglucosaminyldiphosphoundecaprenol N-acetyl-beta-D-mannosaminyltransferase